MNAPDQRPDPTEARRRYRELAAGYDRRIALLNRLRRRIISRAAFQPGDHVLDMGCGTGASFHALREAVGRSGRVTGIELTEDMALIARQRIRAAGWDNVEVIVGDATTTALPAGVDGILFFLTNDLTRIPAVVQRAVAAGRHGATVVAFGPCHAHGWAAPVNLIMRPIARRYVTTFEGYDEPWSHLAAVVPGLRIRRLFFGAAYLAVAHTRG